ncbi:MAG: tetratricopeptide repeat protein [Candidatus Promineifilaceae bacterium]
MVDLNAFIPIDRRHALSRGEQLPNRTQGTALFADISGFTPLTGALAAEFGRKRGAETVLQFINPIYDALIHQLHQYGGSVIGFAGDAITCWFDGDLRDTARRATACALAMQTAMQQFAIIITPNGTEVALAIKVALASGRARRFVVGNPDIQLVDVLAGDTLQRMAQTEGYANSGEVLLSPEVVALVGAVDISEYRDDVAVIAAYHETVARQPWPVLAVDAISAETVQAWLIPAVYERITAGGGFLGELRPATALFMRFSGIDYDGDEAAGEKFNAFIRWVQSILKRYAGTLIQLTIGDKGSFLYAAFGAPYTSGEDTARALATALDLQQLPHNLAFIASVQIGVSRGQVWSGGCGSVTRRTFGVMGNQVNMSARLMAKAENGQVLVNAEHTAEVVDAFQFEHPRQIQVKGRDAPLPVTTLIGRKTTQGSLLHSDSHTPLVGQADALAQVGAWAWDSAENQGKRIILHGAAGIGKSHLAAVVCHQARDAGWRVTTALCQSVSRTTLYYPWQQLFQQLLGLPREPAIGESQADFAQTQIFLIGIRVAQINRDWLSRMPLLGDLLGLPIPDTPVTASFDPQLRQESLFALVLDMLRWWAAIQPLLLFIDSAESIDEVSVALLKSVEHGISQHPILLLMAQITPPADADTAHDSLRLLEILPLDRADTAALIHTQFDRAVTPLLVDLIFAQAHGNPYFTRELIRVLRDSGQIARRGEWWGISADLRTNLDASQLITHVDNAPRLVKNVDLTSVRINVPDSVHNIVLARIDQLPERQKLMLKVASVLGHVFQLDILVDVHPSDEKLDELRLVLSGLKSADFTDERSLLVHLFKHSTAHDVAYETLLFAQRRDLHRAVAEWYESLSHVPLDRLGNDALIAPNFAVIAFHWQHAEDREREQVFARLAGHYAAANYANAQAVRYFSRALDLTSADDYQTQFDLLLAREQVYDWMGERETQSADLNSLLHLADQLQDDKKRATVQLQIGNYHRWLGEYEPAKEAIQQAMRFAAGNPDLQLRANLMLGRLLWIQRTYQPAREQLEATLQTARKMQQRKVEADCLLNLGNINFFLGNHAQSIPLYHEAQAIYKTLDERKDQAGALVMEGLALDNTGDYAESRKLLQQALGVCRAIGYRVGENNILGNIGVNYEFVGQYDEAIAIQEQALAVSRDLEDVEGHSFALSNLTLLYGSKGDLVSAEKMANTAMPLHQMLQDKRSEAFTLTYLGHAILQSGTQLQHAKAAYLSSVAIRRELGEHHFLIDNYAGLAEIERRDQQFEAALAHVRDILAWIEANDIDAVEHPLRIYWACYQVLRDTQDASAAAVLETAHKLLHTQAEKIVDDAMRQSFLSNIAVHRAIETEIGHHG